MIDIHKILAKAFEGQSFLLDGELIDPDEVFHSAGILPAILSYIEGDIKNIGFTEKLSEPLKHSLTGWVVDGAAIRQAKNSEKMVILLAAMHTSTELFDIDANKPIEVRNFIEFLRDRDIKNRGAFSSKNPPVNKSNIKVVDD